MPKRVDQNQKSIVAALRAAGASVEHLHAIGRGCPDILVGWRNQCFLFEIKNPAQKPSARKLTPDEARWHAEWRGQLAIVETAEEALLTIGAI